MTEPHGPGVDLARRPRWSARVVPLAVLVAQLAVFAGRDALGPAVTVLILASTVALGVAVVVVGLVQRMPRRTAAGADLVKQPGAEVERAVLDAELVDDAQEVEREQARPRLHATLTVIGAPSSAAVRAGVRAAPRAVGRAGWTTGTGAVSWARRATSAATHGHLRAQLRQAIAAGDTAQVETWSKMLDQAKNLRQQRLMRAPKAAIAAGKVTGTWLAIALLLLLVGGVLSWLLPDGLGWASWWQLVADVFVGALTVLGWLGALALVGGPVLVAVLAYREGQRLAEPPRWLLADEERDEATGTLVTADGIVTALRHMPIPKMKQAFKAGWMPRFDLTPVREGTGQFKGYRAIFDTPPGVPPAMIVDQVPVLAHNLHRNKVEVWPADYGQQKGGKPGYVNLYVADTGIMDRPTPEYPLLHAGTADVFFGVPEGITQRGDVVMAPVVGSNVVFGGQPGQGKSNAVRVYVAGVALDPLAEIRVHVFAKNGDFDAYEPRLSLYQKGATPEHVVSATEHLERLYEEVGRREGRLAELGAKKVTRALAEKHPDMRPLVVVFSECHELFGKSDTAGELAVTTLKRGRKTAVTLVFDTQSSRAGAIPGELVENVGVNGCFAVKSWRSNDGFLGDGSFAAGIRATELRFNVDRGTMLTTGMTEELFEIVRCFFIAVDDDAGWDQAAEIVERAMAQLDGAEVPDARPVGDSDEERPDDLAAIRAVLHGQARTLTTTVVERLRDTGGRYAKWSTGDLRQALAVEKIPPRKDSEGRMVVRLGDVAGAIAARDRGDEDDVDQDDE